MEGQICLIELYDGAELVLVMQELANSKCVGVKLQSLSKKANHFDSVNPNYVLIGNIDNKELLWKAMVKTEIYFEKTDIIELYNVVSNDIIKKIRKFSTSLVIKLKLDRPVSENNSNSQKLKTQLHKRIHVLKREISINTLNNIETKLDEIEYDSICDILGYEIVEKESNRDYKNYRVVPSKGYIKIYRG